MLPIGAGAMIRSSRCLAFAAALFFAAAAPGYEEAAVARGGTISGRVTFLGRPPTPRLTQVTKDIAVCGSTHADDAFQVSQDGGVQDVVVHLLEVAAGKKWAIGLQPVLDQKECHYQPHVQVVREHATLQIKSGDPILHNVHSFLNGGSVINMAVPPKPGLVLHQKLDKPGGMQLKCDVHAFMRGGIFVAANPYYALTAPDGSYQIRDVPPGNYVIATWHEQAGPVNEPIVVTAGAAVTWNARVR